MYVSVHVCIFICGTIINHSNCDAEHSPTLPSLQE